MKRNSILLLSIVSFLILTSRIGLTQNFKTEGTKLLDPNGNEFIIRGVNNAHAWYGEKAEKILPYFKELKINTVRVVWETKGNVKSLENVIEECLRNKIIPMIELHDATGDTSVQRLMELVDYYTDKKTTKVLLPYDNRILINIANEWGDHTTTATVWKDAYTEAIRKIRNAGYKAPIVIDAPGWGQNHEPILAYGQELINSDPLNNIMFSVHMYYSWNDPNKVESELQKLYDANLPMVVGEFGYNFDKGFNNLKSEVDHIAVMRKCHELKYGYLAWSWSGNNKVNAWLDMAEKRDWETLTWWGRQVLYSEYGITKNAQMASIFPNETEEEKAERLKREEKAAKKAEREAKREKKQAEQEKKRRELLRERSEKLREKAERQKQKQIERQKKKEKKKAARSKAE